jgi:predicted GNAT family acetyltransferase
MTDTYEFPDEAGYPDGVGTLDQTQVVLIQEVDSPPRADGSLSDVDFYVVNDDDEHCYTAAVGDTEIGYLTYETRADDRVALVTTMVFPEFRGQGVASELIRRVLVQLREQGKTITILCPIVRAFIDAHPEFSDVVDADHPGIREVHRAQR